MRNAAVHAQSRLLARPRKAFLSIAPNPDDAEAEESLPDIESLLRESHEKGWTEGQAAALQESRAAAQAEGYEEGLKEGRADAEAAANAAVKERLDNLESLFKSLTAQNVQFLSLAEDDMVALCLAAIVRILGETAATADGIRQALQQALAQFQSRNLAAIHLHQADVAALKDDPDFRIWLEQFDPAGHVQLVADSEVRMGGMVLRSPEGSLDARLETQLDLLRMSLLAASAQRRSLALATTPAAAP